MAKQTDTAITGTIGDVIFYKWKGLHLIRSKGNTGNQAPEAKAQAKIMGKASAVSAKLRAALKPLFPETANRKLMYRLNNALQQWLRTNPLEQSSLVENIPVLNGFAFSETNEYGPAFYAAIPVRRSEGGQLFLQIPSFDSPNPIHPLAFSGEIKIKAIAVSCNLHNPLETTSSETNLLINYDGNYLAAQELLLEQETRAGQLTVVGISVNGQVGGIVRAMFN